jgi:ribosomal protein L11 methyltransferase
VAAYPALEIRNADHDIALSVVDDFSPTAAQDHEHSLTIFFADRAARDHARHALARHFPLAVVTSREVDDEDWARRSQQNLAPVTVERVTIYPRDRYPRSGIDNGAVSCVIVPSMGFGTGHHPTTRLCLLALQTLDLRGAEALDVGTGSGILAIVARLLGARSALGIDCDIDAVRAATENLQLNPAASNVRFSVDELRTARLPAADVVTANLTAALLAQQAGRLRSVTRPSGTLILGGFRATDQPEVLAAFGPTASVWQAEEDGWASFALTFRAPGVGGVSET